MATSDVDVLEQEGHEPLLAPGWSRLLGAVLLVAGLCLWLGDGQLRDHEQEALAQCAARAQVAIVRAENGLEFLGSLGESAAAGTAMSGSGADWADAASEAASTAARPVRSALAGCRAVDVFVLHGDLRDARAQCTAALTLVAARLETVARHGQDAGGDGDSGSLTACRGGTTYP